MGKSNITNQIRRLRFDNDEMSQQDLAQKAGCTRQTIIAIEQGKYNPSLGLAFKIARAFGKNKVLLEDSNRNCSSGFKGENSNSTSNNWNDADRNKGGNKSSSNNKPVTLIDFSFSIVSLSIDKKRSPGAKEQQVL